MAVVDRRTFLAVATTGVLATALVSEAQRIRKPRRIGILSPFSSAADPFSRTFRQSLRELGYVEGADVTFEYRSSEGMTDRLTDLAKELVRLEIEVMVTTTSPAVQAARQSSDTIPIVVGGVDDAVGQGFVASLARPGGNVTGTSWLNTELSAKRLELLKETLPGVSRVAILREAVGGATSLRAAEAAARTLGVRLQIIEIRDLSEFESAFAAIARARSGAVLVIQGPMMTSAGMEIVGLTRKARLPASFSERRFATAGGLMSYGPKLEDLYRKAAAYTDRILKGAKPGDLPVEQPTRFELVINLKTARALGLTVPQSVLLRADSLLQ